MHHAVCRQRILGRSQHQRERRSELVAHVREERRLRAVDRGERFGATALLGIGPRVGKAGRDLAREQFEEAAIRLVERTVRIEADDEGARRPVLSLQGDRNRQRARRRQSSTGRTAAARGRVHSTMTTPDPSRNCPNGHGPCAAIGNVLAGRLVLVVDRGRCGSPREPCLFVKRVEQAERHVAAIDGNRSFDRLEDVALRLGRSQSRREQPQRGEPALANHALGLFGDDAEVAGDPAVVAGQGAVGKRVVRLFGIAVTFAGRATAPGRTSLRLAAAPARAAARARPRFPPRRRARAGPGPRGASARASCARRNRCRGR